MIGVNEMMINNMNEFIKEHPHAVIVNYDIADKFECGKTYRTSTNKTEEFRKDKKGKYLEYPYIQPYLSLSDLSSYELFIIFSLSNTSLFIIYILTYFICPIKTIIFYK